MNRLLFAPTPTMPNQGCRFLPRQPTVAWFALWRQRYANHTAVKTFFGMMVDSGTKRFKVTPCTAGVATMLDVSRADLSIDGRQFFAAPKLVETFNPGLDLELVAWLADIGQIDRQYVGAVDVLNVPPGAFGLILSSDVVR